MENEDQIPDGVHDHDLEPPGLGDPEEPYFLPDIDDADEERDLSLCSNETIIPEEVIRPNA